MYQDRFDDGEWTYACRFTPEGDSDANYAEHVRAMKEVTARAEAATQRLVVLICQEPGFPAPNSSWRKKVAEMTASPSFRPIHCAIVTRNPLIRGVVTALNWVRKREYSEDIFGEIDAALGWLEAARGHPLPALRRAVLGWGSDSPWVAIEGRMRSIAARSVRIVERRSERPPPRRP